MTSSSHRTLQFLIEALNGNFPSLTHDEINRVVYVFAFNHYGDGWKDLKDIVQFLEPAVEDFQEYATDGFEAGTPEADAYDYLVSRGDLFLG